MNRTLKFVLLGLAGSLVVSCASTQENRAPTEASATEVLERSDGTTELPTEWWNRPGAIGKFAAVGTAKIDGSEEIAKSQAEASARAALAVTLEAEIQVLAELWSQEAGDLTNEGSLSSMFNDESFTRQLVESALLSARVDRYQTDDGSVKCLVVLENTATFLESLVARGGGDGSDSDVKNRKARAALDTMINAEKKKAEASKAELQPATDQ